MPLQSQHFRGDTQLEGTLVSDRAHLVVGSNGPHVAKVQVALNLLENAGLAPDGRYGPLTAAAVLAFKRKRSILGAGQTSPDNIVGKRTMAALDAEMLQRERQPNPLPPLPPPLPPTPPPAGASFGIRAEGETPGSLPVQSAMPPSFFQIIDLINKRAAVYRFEVPGDVAVEGIFPFLAGFRRFQTNAFFTVEGFDGKAAAYETLVEFDEDKRQRLSSDMAIGLSPASMFPLRVPMFVHISLVVNPLSFPNTTRVGKDGILRFLRLIPFPDRI